MKAEDVLKHLRETLPDFDLLSAAVNAEFRARFGDADPAEVIARTCFVDRAYPETIGDALTPAEEWMENK